MVNLEARQGVKRMNVSLLAVLDTDWTYMFTLGQLLFILDLISVETQQSFMLLRLNHPPAVPPHPSTPLFRQGFLMGS